jgi:hypothetical protein
MTASPSPPSAPSAGARYTLERRGAATDAPDSASSARYDATITTPDVTYRAELLLHDDGTFELAFVGAAAPEPLHKALAMFAKLTARAAPARRTEGIPVWPARVTRWRPTPP